MATEIPATEPAVVASAQKPELAGWVSVPAEQTVLADQIVSAEQTAPVGRIDCSAAMPVDPG